MARMVTAPLSKRAACGSCFLAACGTPCSECTSATGAHDPNADCEHRKHVPNVTDLGGAASLKSRFVIGNFPDRRHSYGEPHPAHPSPHRIANCPLRPGD